MNLYRLFILGVNIKYIIFSILYRHINVAKAFKELILAQNLIINISLQFTLCLLPDSVLAARKS